MSAINDGSAVQLWRAFADEAHRTANRSNPDGDLCELEDELGVDYDRLSEPTVSGMPCDATTLRKQAFLASHGEWSAKGL